MRGREGDQHLRPQLRFGSSVNVVCANLVAFCGVQACNVFLLLYIESMFYFFY